jgi:hypothetical protein
VSKPNPEGVARGFGDMVLSGRGEPLAVAINRDHYCQSRSFTQIERIKGRSGLPNRFRRGGVDGTGTVVIVDDIDDHYNA